MANEYLQRTPTSTGNRRVFTISAWVKCNINSSGNALCNTHVSGSTFLTIRTGVDGNTNAVLVYTIKSGVDYSRYWTIADRDHSSWAHHIFAFNSTAENVDDRVIYYKNGAKVTSYSDVYGSIPQNYDFDLDPSRSFDIFRNLDAGTFGVGQLSDYFFVDGQALTPDVFGFYKDGDGYQSSGTTQATDFRPGQWSPRAPKSIKYTINRSGGFGVNGFYLPMNDSSNPGADFHCAPNSIIKLKGEDLPQPQNGAPATSDAYVSQLRSDPFAANLVLAIPGITGGQGSGYGDYSADIKGSGSNKTITSPAFPGVFTFSSYYGSALIFDVFDGNNLSTPNNSDFNFSGGEDFTVELWYYRQVDNANEALIGVFENSSARRAWQLEARANAGLRFEWWSDGSSGTSITTANNAVPKDQWHHICAERSGDTITLYVNGVSVVVDITAGSIYNNTTDPLRIGMLNAAEDQMLTGKLQDVRVYKGVAKYKGGFDVPKPYTPVGIESWRATTDTCKNNFMTMSPLSVNNSSAGGLNISLSDGNLTLATDGTANQAGRGSFVVSSGKWYFETSIPSATGLSSQASGVGVVAPNIGGVDGSSGDGYAIIYRETGGAFLGNGASRSDPASGTYPTYVAGDIIGVALDIDNGDVEFFKNGVSAATFNFPAHAVSGTDWTIESLLRQTDSIVRHNFGQNPSFFGTTTAGTNADDSGKGLFKYAPPTGFLALCEDNLPTPAIADPGKHFKTVLYNGDGGDGHSITGLGFQPDLVWIKERTDTSSHQLFDIVRGAGLQIASNSSTGDRILVNRLTSFDSDGFTVSNSAAVNSSTDTFVAWCWKAGGAAVSNTDGTITSQVSTNQTAGFSIVSYTGNGITGSTVGHGLGKTPAFIIIKQRNGTNNWPVWTKALPEGDNGTKPYGYLDLPNGWNISTPADIFSTNANANTNSVFYIGSNSLSNNNTDTYIAYCWTEIEGFSKFGSYIGNGSADGPFVYCGFKPAWVLIKKTNGSGNENWRLFDSSRCPTNQNNKHLLPSSNAVESTESGMDFLSNGFKLRDTDAHQNQNETTYIFVAFAESPFQTANAK